jgi:hypothetical protein
MLIQHNINSINGFAGTFPDLRRKYLNQVNIRLKCIKRLYLRYNKQLNTL